VERQSYLAFFNDYYTGNHPLPWLAPQAREEFRRILRMTRSNYMGLVCDATAERASIEGFRFGREASRTPTPGGCGRRTTSTPTRTRRGSRR
jgi:hypothetical protein